MNEEIKAKRDELARLEADHYSNIQYEPTWIETSVKDLKQDVNASRRKSCYDHHCWGYIKGFDAGFALAMEEAKVLVERLEILIAEGYANQIDKKVLKEFKARSE